MIFLIQTIENTVKHDFSFTLLESIDYHKWLSDMDIEYILSEKPCVANCIPVGSVEFVSEYLNTFHNKTPLPINISTCLFPFAKRRIINGNQNDVYENSFVKSNDKIKSFTKIVNKSNIANVPQGNYQISELMDIDSEWRAFVYKNELVGLNNYSGGFTVFPDISTLNDMINIFKENNAPVAYTIDVGIYNKYTVPIEVHDFFSCGLYGFADLNLLPWMYFQWFKEFISK
jgi:hypothetical protein